VARADVVKADLQQQQRQRDLNDANVAGRRLGLSLGCLLFQDPTTTYTVESTLDALPPLPDRNGGRGRRRSRIIRICGLPGVCEG